MKPQKIWVITCGDKIAEWSICDVKNWSHYCEEWYLAAFRNKKTAQLVKRLRAGFFDGCKIKEAKVIIK